MKNEAGITLMALVITIIILLILAGVTVGMATSGTGLFDKAKYASEKYLNAQVAEGKVINSLESEIQAAITGSSRGDAKLVRKVVKEIKYNPLGVDWSDAEYTTAGYGIVKINAKGLPNYEQLTINNFCMDVKSLNVSLSGSDAVSNNDGVSFEIKKYENGFITLNLPRHIRDYYGAEAELDISVVAFYIDYE